MNKFNLFVIVAANVFLVFGGYFISQKIAHNASVLKQTNRVPSSVRAPSSVDEAAAVSLDELLNARIVDRQRQQAREQARKQERQEAIDELVKRIENDGFKVQLEDEGIVVED